jgi:hypothetical protein
MWTASYSIPPAPHLALGGATGWWDNEAVVGLVE